MLDIRTGCPDDFEAILALWDREAAATRVPSNAVALSRLIDRDPGALLVAGPDTGEIVGTLVVGWDGWRGHLYRMVVASAFRRRGVATALLDEAARRLRAKGCARFDAVVLEDNQVGRAFWKGSGFEVDLEDRRWTKWITET